MAQKITHWLLITLVLSLGFGQLLRFNFYGIPIYLHDILIIILLTTNFRPALQAISTAIIHPLFLDWKHNIFKFWWQENHKHATPLSIFLVGLLLGWYQAFHLYPLSSLFLPSLYAFRILAYLALYLSLKQSKILVPKIYFIISGMIMLIIGVAQYLLMPDMRLFQYLGWDDHLNRLTLPHFDPTFTAVMLALALLSLSLVHWYIGILFGLAILLTYSRSVWLSLAFTGFLFIRNKLLLLLACTLLLLAIFALPKRFGEGTNLLRTYSISSRFTSDLSYVEKYSWDLLIGRGMNTLILETAPSKYSNHATGPNNSYLYLLATTGVLGLLGFLSFLREIYRTSHFKMMIIFVLIASCFNNVLFYPFTLLWMLLVQLTVPSEA